ncbi:MAG: HAD-IIIA family hydrolase [Parvibaculum sedimenti]|uniref:D-glycero-alpha-D-manno-heptose-1,7-bisphosphate 7-phosphatase n=1 Tax=Parvibaculum sedimenti TaxID=2608632 RepID=UPI003BB69A41
MLLENGVWISDPAPARHGGPALFLDRDGVIVREINYLSRPEDVALETGIAELIGWAHARGIAVAAITNQSGVARGRFSWAEYEAVEAEVARQLAARNVALDLVIVCAFHEDHTEGFGQEHARWRKPGPAMLELAAEKLGLDLGASIMIGDKASDVEAARNAGLTHAIHVLTGHGEKERAAALKLARPGFAVHAAADLHEALALLKSGAWERP